MIPQTAAALFAFLLLVAPGIVFEGLRERRRPKVDQTPFREVSGIALASLSFSILSMAVLAGVRARVPRIMPDPGRWLREGHRYVNGNYRLIAGFVVAELLLAVSLAIAWSWARGLGRQPSIFKVSMWFRVFRELPPTGAETFVRVFTQSGVEYFGKLISYTTDFDLDSRELFLGEPLWRRLPNETDFTLLRPPWRWLILPGSAIQGIWVSYLQSRTVTPEDMPTDEGQS